MRRYPIVKKAQWLSCRGGSSTHPAGGMVAGGISDYACKPLKTRGLE